MSIPTLKSNIPNPLDSLHRIIENLQDLLKIDKKVSDTCLQKIPIELKKLNQQQTETRSSQHQLKYATISFLPENETTQELKSRCSNYEGIVSRNVKIFQKYIDERHQNNKNPSL